MQCNDTNTERAHTERAHNTASNAVDAFPDLNQLHDAARLVRDGDPALVNAIEELAQPGRGLDEPDDHALAGVLPAQARALLVGRRLDALHKTTHTFSRRAARREDSFNCFE